MSSLSVSAVIRCLVCLMLPLLLVGCAGNPKPVETATDLAPGFSRSGQQSLGDQWWQSFDDAQLNRLVDQALADNFTLAASYQRLVQARAAADRQSAALFPAMDASLGAQRQGADGDYSDTFSGGLSANYELDLWGRVQSLAEAERLRAEASEADFQAAAISLTGEIANTWFQLVEQRAQQALARNQLNTNREVLSLVEARFSAGQTGSADVLRQRQLVSSSRERLDTLRGDIRVLENQLAVLLGQTPQQTALPESARLPELPALPETGVPADLIQRRPDVKQSLRLVQAADQDLAAAISNRFPRLSLEASINDQADNASELFDNWLATLAGNLVVPLIDGGERRAEVTRSEAVFEERLQDYRQAVLTAIQEVEDALAREHQQQQRLLRLERQIELAQASYRQLRTRYFNGAVSYIEVLNALQDQQDLQRTQLTAQQQLLNSRVALYRALAGSIDGTNHLGQGQNETMERNQT